MCRASIIGNAAGGKSTLCKAIVKAHGLPLYAVDKFQWKPGWVAAPEEEVARELREVISQDRWLLDGWGPWETIEERFERSDTIIFVDHSLWRHLWWATKRQIKAYLIPNSVEKPEGCDLTSVTWKMYQMIWRIHRDFRPELLRLVEQFKGEKDVYHIRSPRDLKKFAIEQC